MSVRTNGAALAAIRKSRGIRQRDLARLVGVTQVYISRIERGERQPDTSIVRKIAGQLGVQVEAITYEVPEPEAVSA